MISAAPAIRVSLARFAWTIDHASSPAIRKNLTSRRLARLWSAFRARARETKSFILSTVAASARCGIAPRTPSAVAQCEAFSRTPSWINPPPDPL
jgi:hypothetical protein